MRTKQVNVCEAEKTEFPQQFQTGAIMLGDAWRATVPQWTMGTQKHEF